MLEQLEQPLQGVVLLDVAFEELMQRLTGRRTCKDCGAIYNVYLSAPKQEGVCDSCGGELFQREDDNEETIGNRLKVYEDQTAPLVHYYAEQDKLHTIAGVGDVNDITAKIGAVFDTI
jgi:adenylate kinase